MPMIQIVLGFAVIFTLRVEGQRQFNSILPNVVNTKAEPFKFSYKVNNEGNDHSHGAESDGSKVTGEYQVLLPDGRRQKVTYIADDTGYRAFIQYEGEATIPRSPFSMSTRNPRSWGVTPTTEATGIARFTFIENQQDVNLVSQTVSRSPQNQMYNDFDSGRQVGSRGQSRHSARQKKKIVMKVVHPNSEGVVNDSESQYKVSPTTRNGRRMKKMVVYKVIPPNSTGQDSGNHVEQYGDENKSNTQSTTSGFGIYKSGGEGSQVISNYQLLLTSPTTPRTWGNAYTDPTSEVESWKITTEDSRNSVQTKLTELTQKAESTSNPDVRGSNAFSDNSGFINRYESFTTTSPTTMRQPVRNSKRRNNLGNKSKLQSYNNGFSSTPENYYSAPPTTGRPPARYSIFGRNNVNNLSENNAYRSEHGSFYTVPSTTERQQVSYDAFSQSNAVESYKFGNSPEIIQTSYPITDRKSEPFDSLKESNVDNAPENKFFIIIPETIKTASPTANRQSERYNSFGRGDIVENNDFSSGLQRQFTASPVIEQTSERYNSFRGNDVNNVQENGFSIRPERLHTVSPPSERQPSRYNTVSRNKVDRTSENDDFNIRPDKLNAAPLSTERQPKRNNSPRRSSVDNVQGNNEFSNSTERVLAATPSSRRQSERYNSLRGSSVDNVQENNDFSNSTERVLAATPSSRRQSERYDSLRGSNVDNIQGNNDFSNSTERVLAATPSSRRQSERYDSLRGSNVDNIQGNNDFSNSPERVLAATPSSRRHSERYNSLRGSNVNNIQGNNDFSNSPERVLAATPNSRRHSERYNSLRRKKVDKVQENNDSNVISEKLHTTASPTERQSSRYNTFNRSNVDSTSINDEFKERPERLHTSSLPSERQLERSTTFRRSEMDSTLENNGSTVSREILPSTTERQIATYTAFRRRNSNSTSRKQYISRRKQMQIESSTTFDQPERYETFRGSSANIKSQSNDSINKSENDPTVSPNTEEQKTSYINFRRRNAESNYRQKRTRTMSNVTSVPPSNEVRKIRGRITFRDSSSVNTAQLQNRSALVNSSKIDELEINYGIKNLTRRNNSGTLSQKWRSQGDTIQSTKDGSMSIATTTEAQCANCNETEEASEDQILPPNDTRKVVKRSSDYNHRQHKRQDHSHFRRG